MTLVSDARETARGAEGMEDLYNVPRGSSDWKWNRSTTATAKGAQQHSEFELAQPKWPFSESDLTDNIAHWPSAWLLKK